VGYVLSVTTFCPTEIDYPDGGKMVASYTYDQTGVYHYMTASTHTNTQTNLDGYGRLNWVSVENASGGYYSNNYCYDGNGNVQFASYRFVPGTFVCSGTGGDTSAYDALGRVLTITHGDSSTVTYSYNKRATEVTDENGASRIVQVDGLGRPAAVCEIVGTAQGGSACNLDITGTGFLTTYAYSTDTSKSNALKVVVTQGLQTRTFETDSLGRTISVVEPESGTTTYSYAYSTTSGLGLTVTRVRPQANQTGSAQTTTTTQYDSLGRVVSVNYNDSLTPNKIFAYDTNIYWTQTPTNIKGRLAVTGGGSGATANGALYSYDAMGRVINMWQCGPASCGTSYQSSRPLSFSYDWAGNLTQESDVVSGTINYTRSIAGEVTSMTNSTYQNSYNPATLVSNVVNGADGPVSYTLGNGLTGYRSYDSLGRLSGQWVCNGPAAAECSGGTQIYGTTSAWKGVQMQEQNDTVLNQQVTLGYDGFNRLTARTVTSGTVQNYTYAYDRYGNRTQTALQTGYNFNPTYSATTNHITSSGYAYDAAGNMTNDTFHSYTYDAEGNIIKVDGGSTATYVYDVFNHRIHVQTASATTEFAYDYAGRRVSSWLSPNNYGNEGRIYWDGQQVAYRSTDGTTYFDHQDILGTERLRSNYAGSVGSSYVSLPWGDGYTATVNSSGADQDNAHFADLERDAESGTEHAQFRNYTSAQGRWLSPDPYSGSYDASNPQSMNRYGYVLNNPTSFTDPSGLVTCPLSVCMDSIDGEVDGDNGEAGGGGDASNGGGGGYGQNKPAPSNRVPNKITCGTVLPNGRTVGSYVNQLSNSINGSAGNPVSTPYGPGPNPSAPGPISVASQVYSGTNFRGMFGQGAGYTANAFLGDAGNFAYAAVSANIGVPYLATELAAAAYSWTHHSPSDWVGPLGMDPSATVQVPAGYGASCKGY
jgi:RHS repeat-associated protein